MSTDKKYALLATALLILLAGSIVTALVFNPAYAVVVILAMVAGGFVMLVSLTRMKRR